MPLQSAVQAESKFVSSYRGGAHSSHFLKAESEADKIFQIGYAREESPCIARLYSDKSPRGVQWYHRGTARNTTTLGLLLVARRP